MGKLHFHHGVMGSGKSSSALAKVYSYESRMYRVLLIKSDFDTRDGSNVISRAMTFSKPCVLFNTEQDLYTLFVQQNRRKHCDCIVVDEAQFLRKEQVEQLKKITIDFADVDVFCYGLLTNFLTEFFEGSKRLVEIADEVTNEKVICDCKEIANVNALLIDEKVVKEKLGDTDIVIGDTKKEKKCYKAMCYKCWLNSEEYKEGTK